MPRNNHDSAAEPCRRLFCGPRTDGSQEGEHRHSVQSLARRSVCTKVARAGHQLWPPPRPTLTIGPPVSPGGGGGFVFSQRSCTKQKNATCLAAPRSPMLMNSVRGVPAVRSHSADFCCSQCGVNCYDPVVVTTTEAPRVVVRRHYNTVVRRVPVNHHVKVQMPRPAPIIHTLHVVKPNAHHDGGDYDHEMWSGAHKRWCCYKYKEGCPKQVVDRNIYHHLTKIQKLHVPVPLQEPRSPSIIHKSPQVYRVPSPPKYVHVPAPGPKIHKVVTINKDVPYPVKEPPQVITVKKPYTVKVQGHRHYVDVPVPSPPHIVNTVHDYNCDSHFGKWCYVWSGTKKQWCCAHQHLGCPGSWHHHHVVTITGVQHLKHCDCHAGLSNWYHGWSRVQKSWCCDHHHLICPGMAHGQWHARTVVHTMGHHAGHGGYDCDAGYSNWEHGWSYMVVPQEDVLLRARAQGLPAVPLPPTRGEAQGAPL
ncbi:unnamed protein product [Symbiodinium sp. CCMP2592]|nr:unnamed protein product [Symbiodinium sp. CCMP2592]